MIAFGGKVSEMCAGWIVAGDGVFVTTYRRG